MSRKGSFLELYINKLPLFIISYFSVSFILRISSSNTLNLDEAEQYFFADDLKFIYKSQLPLYNWIVFIFTKIIGKSFFLIIFIKFLLLTIFHLSLLHFCKIICQDNKIHGATLYSILLFTPQISWEMHRDLTHTLVAYISIVITSFSIVLFRFKKKQFILAFSYIIGVLSKINIHFFLISLLLVNIRKIFENKRIFFFISTILVSFLILFLMNLDFFNDTEKLYRNSNGFLNGFFELVISILSVIF